MTPLPARRIAPPAWMTQAAALAVVRALSAKGQPARFVGGCVRDAILGIEPADIDLATPEEPAAVIRLLEAAKLKAVPTGIDHGTVTAVSPPLTIQVTTLRCDVSTDGRRAVVAFGTDWLADAARRDFTINALYADADGTLYDPVGGLADLEAGRVRFIGDAAMRVAEDYLRVPRFFRFHARFGRGAADAAALAACGEAAPRLAQLSGERVRDELLKIVVLPKAAEAFALMLSCGVLDHLVPGHRFERELFERLAALQAAVSPEPVAEPDPWPRLALLFGFDGARAQAALDRLKFSNAQRHRLDGLLAPVQAAWADLAEPGARPVALYRIGAEACLDDALRLALADPSRAAALPAVATAIRAWRRPVFPLRGADLLRHGLKPGPNISAVLKELESWWAAGGFAASREACLAEMRRRVTFEETALPEAGKVSEAEGGKGSDRM